MPDVVVTSLTVWRRPAADCDLPGLAAMPLSVVCAAERKWQEARTHDAVPRDQLLKDHAVPGHAVLRENQQYLGKPGG